MKKSMKKTAAIGFTMTALAAALLAGCGGGGGGFAGLGGNFFGHVADGSVSGATVRFDIDNSGVCGDTPTENAPGQMTTTDAVGNFTYPNSAITQGKMVCATGGTDISTGAAFIGEMKAPGGSTQVTPATTLVQAVIDAAPLPKPTPAAAATTLATNLGLTGTNLLTADPVALAGTNPKLAQTTSAIQTMLLQIANNVAASATNTLATPAQTAALYSSAVAGLATAIAPVVPPAVPVIVDLTNVTPAGTALVDTMVTTAVTQTVTAVQANPTAAATVPGVATVVPANVAAVAASNITNVAQQVATVPAATLVSPPAPGTVSASLSAQTNTSGQTATATIASTGLLDTGSAATPAQIVTTAATTTTAVNSPTATAATIQAAVTTAITTNSPAAVVTAPVVPPPAVVFTNYLPILGATVTGTAGGVAGTPVAVGVGPVTVTGPITSTTLNFGTAVGAPVFAPTLNAVFTVTSTVPGDNRQFSGTISGLVLTGGVLTVPATATATVNGTHTNGTTASATATGATTNAAGVLLLNSWVAGTVGSMGSVTLNVGKLLTDLSTAATTGTAGLTGFANLNLLKGNFSVDMTLNGAAIGNAVGFTPTQTINVIVN